MHLCRGSASLGVRGARTGRGNSGVYFRACAKSRRKRLRLTKQEACMASPVQDAAQSVSMRRRARRGEQRRAEDAFLRRPGGASLRMHLRRRACPLQVLGPECGV